MKIARSTMINVFFIVGTSIAPRINEVKDWEWSLEQPNCLTKCNGGAWVSDEVYAWKKDNTLEVGPKESPYFRIKGTPQEHQFEIHNILSDRFCVIKRHDNDQSPWLQLRTFSGNIHKINAKSVSVYYQK
jgi:hypothetical protein